MSPNATRQGYVQYAGQTLGTGGNLIGQKLGHILNVTDPDAVDNLAFISLIQNLGEIGGSTDITNVLNYIRQEMFTAENRRPISQRVVILLSLFGPTAPGGIPENPVISESAAKALKRRAQHR